jgi:hypothetical protein
VFEKSEYRICLKIKPAERRPQFHGSAQCPPLPFRRVE